MLPVLRLRNAHPQLLFNLWPMQGIGTIISSRTKVEKHFLILFLLSSKGASQQQGRGLLGPIGDVSQIFTHICCIRKEGEYRYRWWDILNITHVILGENFLGSFIYFNVFNRMIN